MYQALYRKYRPKNFDEVVGQEQVTLTLKNEIAMGRIGHAYLFTGSRGTGKTSCSKIIAKAVNCPNQSDGNPCGVCDICTGIEDGSILDVSEIDAASNNSVDDVRQLREEANYTPAVVKYRVYIIDETHMLSPSAFNALLKIMEEPPEHVIFILATTEVHKIPATILSRCQRFDFKRIKPDILKQQLLKISQAEGIDLQDDAAQLIAQLSEGGMRDAFSLLDVCWSSGNQITVSVVAEAAGLAMQDCLFTIGDGILKKDIPLLIQTIDKMYDASIDFEKMCVQMISHYRGLMMAKSIQNPEQFVLGLDEDVNRLKQQAELYSMPQILYCLTVLQDTLSRMNRTSQTRTELEMALIKLCNPSMDRSMDAIQARLDKLEQALKSGNFVVASPKSVNPPVTQEQTKDSTSPELEVSNEVPEVKPPKAKADKAEPATEVVRFEQWAETLEHLKQHNTALYGFLVDASAYLNREILLIDCDNPLFLEMIRSNEFAKKSIHDALIEATGRDYRIGPYKKNQYKLSEKQVQDPLENILNSAAQQGIDIAITDK